MASKWRSAARTRVGIAGGRGLLKVMPLTCISRIAAAIMLILAGLSLAEALS